jgi:hypothetical protein
LLIAIYLLAVNPCDDNGFFENGNTILSVGPRDCSAFEEVKKKGGLTGEDNQK